MFKRFFVASLLVGTLTMPSSGSAETVCAMRDSMISKLKEKYGEAERGMGLSGTKAVVEVWSSDKTGTWTIVMTRPDGVTCVVAAGDSWIQAPPSEGPEA